MPGKVLIISYYWPPSGGAGVQRWLKFVKYLRKYQWEPVIYAPLNPEYPAIDETLAIEIPPGIEVIKQSIWEPYQLYKKITRKAADEKVNASGLISEKSKPGILDEISIWIRGNFLIPDPRKFWIQPSINFLSNWIKDQHIDAIVSTGPPHSMHLIALGLKEKTGIPWLADFRDPWTNIDFYNDLKLTKWADKKHHKLESEVLSKADKVVVISESMRTDFIKIVNRGYSVITNGFDAEDINKNTNIPDNHFSIAHIGSMAKSRNPVNLWLAISELNNTVKEFKQDTRIKLIGSVDYSVIESIEKAGLSSQLEKIDYQPHDEVISLQKQARVLLLIINDSPNAKVILPGKLFEYIASGRPILCIGPHDGDAAKIIKETQTGYVVSKDEKDDLIEKLKKLYGHYKNNEDKIAISNISKYSRESLTEELSKLLNEIQKN